MSFKAIWANNSPYSKFLISVGIILLCAVFSTLVSTLLSSAIYQVNFAELQTLLNNLEDPRAIAILKLVQTISAIGTFVVPPFLIAYLIDPEPLTFLGVNKMANLRSIVMVVLVVMAAVPVINLLGELNSSMHLPGFLKAVEDWMRDSEDRAAGLTKAFLEMPDATTMLFNLFMVALIPAIGEELLFRGIVQRIFSSWSKNIHVGVWMAAFLFSAMHMQFYGFIPRLLLGAMLGYLFVWSGSLWLSITAHFVNNAAAIIFTFLFQHRVSSIDVDTVGTKEGDVLSVLISLALTISLLYMIYKSESQKRLLSGE
ncbi:MAG TPA: CPBP family intramembrane metalloprotease [Bacteroidia bacterium]|nr:CPBP family intramembrane metalloprotease [Bacteroidia bacterium]